MQLDIFQIDAFSDRQFGGNPAAILPLQSWLPDETLLAIAEENNLAETAFFIAGQSEIELRWFTPSTEVKLCGHATLAAAHVLFQYLDYPADLIRFSTLSGILTAVRRGDMIELDFPASSLADSKIDPALARTLDVMPTAQFNGIYPVLVLESAEQVAKVSCDTVALNSCGNGTLVVTAPGDDCDFVSRFFAPGVGIDEDPVTGSAHCTLTPYWARTLNKNCLLARQLSPRGGVLECELKGDRVLMRGKSALYLQGQIFI